MDENELIENENTGTEGPGTAAEVIENEGCGAKAQSRNKVRNVISWVLWIAFCLLLAWLFLYRLGHLVLVSGDSMYPTLYSEDFIYIWSAGYTPDDGDIIVIDTSYKESGMSYIVKRCIATEGQTVSISYEDNTVTVDGTVLDEPYINMEYPDPMDVSMYYEWQDETFTVPDGCIFVMGDNRNVSLDSRSSTYGFISMEDVVGKKILRVPTGKWWNTEGNREIAD